MSLAVATFATTAGIFLRSRAARRVSSIDGPAPRRFRACAPKTTNVPQNCRRFIGRSYHCNEESVEISTGLIDGSRLPLSREVTLLSGRLRIDFGGGGHGGLGDIADNKHVPARFNDNHSARRQEFREDRRHVRSLHVVERVDASLERRDALS